MARLAVVCLLVLLAGCGSDESWSEGDLSPDGGIEDNMGTFTETRLGNQVVMPGGIMANGQPPTDQLLLIEANLGELSRAVEQGDLAMTDLGFGSWVFMVDITPTWAPPAGGWAVNPLKLRFMMGSGGTHHTLEIDAVGGAALQVPTAVCRVEIFWDRLPATLGQLAPFEIPASVIVRGTFHRANIVPNARRSFLLARNAAGAAATNGLIPPYSYDWMVYAIGASTHYIAASANILACSSPAVNIITLTTGPQMAAALATGARFPIPPMVDFWQMADGGPAVIVGLIDFGVGF